MSEREKQSLRPQGLFVLVAVVGVGLLASAGLFRWGWTRVEAAKERNRETRAGAPEAPADRLDRWLIYGEPQLQNHLAQLRFSSLHPGLITHTVHLENAPDEIWGVDLSGSHPARIERDGLRVTAVLAAPRLFGHGELSGMNANRIPEYPEGAEIPDPEQRARLLCEHFMGVLGKALAKDIEGATLEFAFEPRALPQGAGPEGS